MRFQRPFFIQHSAKTTKEPTEAHPDGELDPGGRADLEHQVRVDEDAEARQQRYGRNLEVELGARTRLDGQEGQDEEHQARHQADGEHPVLLAFGVAGQAQQKAAHGDGQPHFDGHRGSVNHLFFSSQ